MKANILVDKNGCACLTDFGLLTFISDPTNFTPSSSIMTRGTIRWMSPELLSPDDFDFKDSRPTKDSDCYALGMVIYEVLSGQAPFTPYKEAIAMRKILEGENPQRPEGAQGTLFADILWGMLRLCWATQPKSRPGIGAVFKTLEQVSGTWKPHTPRVKEVEEEDMSDWDLTVLSVLYLLLLCASMEDAVLIKSP